MAAHVDLSREIDEDLGTLSSAESADLKDSAADFNTVLAAANLKIKLARAADAVALNPVTDTNTKKPVVITFLPCCNETQEELSNPLSLINSPDADAKLLLERISMKFYIVVDGQHDDAPETSTLQALKAILNIDEERDHPMSDRGCKLYHIFRNDFEVFVYVKGKQKQTAYLTKQDRISCKLCTFWNYSLSVKPYPSVLHVQVTA